ncbi:MAG: GNAT family N-acetyltransferase [Bacteroidota bacterium]
MKIQLEIATADHWIFAEELCRQYELSARIRGTGIARRQPEYIRSKMQKGHAIIATANGILAGFCYIETWGHGDYVANSGLLVIEAFRGQGLARSIKKMAFTLARTVFPDAKVFGITTSSAVMKINSELGYRPVSFAELTPDKAFWKGCQSCPNYDILQRNQQQLCLCTGMLAPSLNEQQTNPISQSTIKIWTDHEKA